MFKRVIVKAIKWNFKWYLGSFASTIATFFLMFSHFDYEFLRSIKYGGTILVISVLAKIIYEYIREIDKLEKKVEEKEAKIDILDTSQTKRDLIKKHNFYGEVLIHLRDNFSQINKLKRLDSLNERKEVSRCLINLCNKLKYLFEKRLNHNYSVSIKLLELYDDGTIDESSKLVTIVRDEKSYFERKDNKNKGNNHTIQENSCFNEIFNNIESASAAYYFCNDLIANLQYKNSSFKDYGSIPATNNRIEREKFWTLPYKSEVVVPISPFLSHSAERKATFFGYLCIDCDGVDSFHKKYDVRMLLGIGDGIYDLLKKYNEL